MRKLLIALTMIISLPAFADQKEECLAALQGEAKIAATKAQERAAYIRKAIALLSEDQKAGLSQLRQNIDQVTAELGEAKALRQEASKQIKQALIDFRKSTPPAGLSVEQTAQALEQAQFDAKRAQEKSENKVSIAESVVSNHSYRLKSYAYHIFKNDNGSLKAKFQALIEDAQDNGFSLQFKGSDQTYVDYIVVQETKNGFQRGSGSGYQLGSQNIYAFSDYFEPSEPLSSAASYEQLGWRAMTDECQATLAASHNYGQREVKQTLPLTN